VTIPPDVLAAAHAELDAWDAARFLKHGNMGATRGLARKPRPLGLSAPPRPRKAPAVLAPPLEPGPLTIAPLKPCLGGCGRSLAAKRRGPKFYARACSRCEKANAAPKRCLDCPALVRHARRCQPCAIRHYGETHPPCACGRPAARAGKCERCRVRDRFARDPIARAKRRAGDREREQRRPPRNRGVAR
jgi:hypothetical protein